MLEFNTRYSECTFTLIAGPQPVSRHSPNPNQYVQYTRLKKRKLIQT